MLDTHSTIWFLEGSSRLSAPAPAAIPTSLAAGEPVFVSAVTIVELIYLVEKCRFPTALLDRLLAELRQTTPQLLVAPLDLATADILRTVPGSVVRDMPDRMIAATAVALGVPLATCGNRIHTSGIPIIW